MLQTNVNAKETVTDFLELWKAIHGGCWPGPPIDLQISQAVREVVAGVALLDLSRSFENREISQQAHQLATRSLQQSLAHLQEHVKQIG